MPCPVPAPPAANGEPGIGVSVPSAWRSKPAIVFVPAVLSLTYRCPTTDEAADAPPAATGRRLRRARAGLRVEVASPCEPPGCGWG